MRNDRNEVLGSTKKPTLRENLFFQSFSEQLIEQITPFIKTRDYEARQVIYFPEDACDWVYWVESGRIKITRLSHDNRSLTFCHLIPGDIFGEELLGGRPTRDDYAEALTNASLLLMRVDDFHRLVRDAAEFGQAIAVALSCRVIDLERAYAASVFCSVSSRIAWGILRLHQKHSKSSDCVIEVTHQELANLVGSTRETTTTVLHDMREAGLIELANRRIIVRNVEELQQWACRAD